MPRRPEYLGIRPLTFRLTDRQGVEGIAGALEEGELPEDNILRVTARMLVLHPDGKFELRNTSLPHLLTEFAADGWIVNNDIEFGGTLLERWADED